MPGQGPHSPSYGNPTDSDSSTLNGEVSKGFVDKQGAKNALEFANWIESSKQLSAEVWEQIRNAGKNTEDWFKAIFEHLSSALEHVARRVRQNPTLIGLLNQANQLMNKNSPVYVPVNAQSNTQQIVDAADALVSGLAEKKLELKFTQGDVPLSDGSPFQPKTEFGQQLMETASRDVSDLPEYCCRQAKALCNLKPQPRTGLSKDVLALEGIEHNIKVLEACHDIGEMCRCFGLSVQVMNSLIQDKGVNPPVNDVTIFQEQEKTQKPVTVSSVNKLNPKG